MFARRRQVDPIEPVDQADQPAQSPAIGGPAAKLLSMLGISPEQMAQTAQEVKSMVEDFRARLERIEAKVDHLQAIVDRGWQNAPDPSRARVDKEVRHNGTR